MSLDDALITDDHAAAVAMLRAAMFNLHQRDYHGAAHETANALHLLDTLAETTPDTEEART